MGESVSHLVGFARLAVGGKLFNGPVGERGNRPLPLSPSAVAGYYGLVGLNFVSRKAKVRSVFSLFFNLKNASKFNRTLFIFPN